MTCEELIEELKKYPSHARVFVPTKNEEFDYFEAMSVNYSKEYFSDDAESEPILIDQLTIEYT